MLYIKLFQFNNNQAVIQPMNELFTFNSQQFQEIRRIENKQTGRIHCRRRPTQLRYQGKTTILQPFNAENKSDKLMSRKVTFNQQISCQLEDIALSQKTIKFIETEQENIQPNRQRGESIQQRLNRKHLSRCVKSICQFQTQDRSMSTFEGGEKKIDLIQKQANISSCLPRTRRSLSVRASPKVVVPLSDRKLPKVFKNNFGNQNLVTSKSKDIGTKNVSLNELKGDLVNLGDLSIKRQIFSPSIKQHRAISRFNKMLQMENKVFEKIYGGKRGLMSD